jgi:drug/metabolite transporter (DMT)-like permease|tara:strand:- start:16784 stop:17692 length:909 start_codon:yes stop_codon:yes gene_type:complete
MELWIPITVLAAFLQNARSALQKHLKGRLSTLGAAYVRFLYAMPFSLVYLWGLHEIVGKDLPVFNTTFLMYCVLGGASQIAFTVLLLYLFQFRNFAVGTTFSKTEVFQVAVLGFLILGDTVTTAAAAAIALAGVGVVVLSAGQSKVSLKALISGVTEKATVIGLVCGAFLGASVVFFRGAALSLKWDDLAMTVAYTLAVSLVIQTIAMGAYLAWKEAPTLKAVFVHWKWSAAVGAVGMAGSVAWFLAFTMQNAAYVRALGQIELVFTFAASIFFFKEKVTRLEVIGIALIILAILLLILSRG